jgi:hypothetical protein
MLAPTTVGQPETAVAPNGNGITTPDAAAAKPKVSLVYSPDPMLDETERIMADYISLLLANKVLTVTK